MNLFSFFKQRLAIPVKLIVYLDAGKGNARGAIVEIRKGIPHILYTILGEQRVGESINGVKSFNSSSLSSLEEILEQTARLLQKTAKGENNYVAEEVYCILAAPYYLSHTSIINYKSEKPTLITQNLIKDIINAKQPETLPSHLDADIGDNRKTLHEKIVEIKINGYHSNNPYNKQALEVSVAIFRTQVELELYQNITRIVKKFTEAPLYIESLSLSTFVALRNRLDAEANFIFITVGNEVTEVSLVKEHTLLETGSFPFGKYSLARLLSKKMFMPPDIALSKVALFHDKKLHVDEMSKLKPIIDETQAEWFSYLEKTIVTLSEETSVPNQIYLIVDTDLKDIFENTITQKGFAGQTLVPDGFSIHTMDTAKFADCCTFGLDIRFDTLLAISASFAGAAKEVVTELYPQKP
ncbi:MAG: hypothetical protein Q7S34_04290 [bacterium]|nr:hypothetical protein [bacterium]